MIGLWVLFTLVKKLQINKSEQIKEISIDKWVGNESINGTNKNFVHWWYNIKEIRFLNNRRASDQETNQGWS